MLRHGVSSYSRKARNFRLDCTVTLLYPTRCGENRVDFPRLDPCRSASSGEAGSILPIRRKERLNFVMLPCYFRVYHYNVDLCRAEESPSRSDFPTDFRVDCGGAYIRGSDFISNIK